MGDPVRRLLATCGLALATALAVAGQASSATHAKVGCQHRAVDVLFWPEGHGEIESVGFPSFHAPHAELYRSGPPYSDARAIAGVLPGSGTFEEPCSPTAVRTPARVGKARTIRGAATVTCSAPRALLFHRVDADARTTLRIYVAGDLLLRMTIAREGSSLAFDQLACVRSAPPA